MARSMSQYVTPRKAAFSKAEKAHFAERLKAVMDERGLTIAETARRLRQQLPEGEGFDDTNLIHYRQGRSIPRPAHLDALSRALGVRVSDLVGAEERRPVTAERAALAPAARTESTQLSVSRLMSEMTGLRSPIQAIEDHGDNVLIRFEQLVPWSVALEILHALKDVRRTGEFAAT